MKELFKKDTKGRLRVWKGEVIATSDGIAVKTYSGIIGGTIKESVTVTEASITMTALEVAESKLKTAYQKKSGKGYFDTKEGAEAYVPNSLMLIHKYEANMAKVKFPCLVMPKLDGVCAGYMDDPDDPHFKSRENNRFEKLDEKAREISKYLDEVQGKDRVRVDSHGELYAHGRKVSEIIEAIKGSNEEVFKEVNFYPFDYMDVAADVTGLRNRLKLGSEAYAWGNPGKPFVPIRILVAHSHDDIERLHEIFLRLDFEGTVVCNASGLYEYDRRTYDKLKKKNLFSEEFEIVGVDYDWAEVAGVSVKCIKFIMSNKEGVQFPAVPAWTKTKRATAYEDKESFAGKLGTIEYRSLTKYGLPFHPVFVAVRDYE